MAELLFRYHQVPADAPADGLLRVAFSSETPVSRIGTGKDHTKGERYLEILDHAPENADLTLLNDRGAFIDEHDMTRQLGAVERAEICADKIGRADLSFCEDDLSKTRSLQMRTRKRPHISFGYIHTRELSCEKNAEGVPVKRFAWMAYEISSVGVPADRSVGVGRTFDPASVDSAKSMNSGEPAQHKIKVMSEQTPPVDEKQIRSAALGEFKTRAKEITQIADVLIKDHGNKDGGQMADKIRSLVNEALATDLSIPEFKTRCMEDILRAKPARPIRMADFASETEQKEYSILRGIQSCIKRGSNVPDGLEGEVHDEVMKRFKDAGMAHDPKGFQVPHDARIRAGTQPLMKRDMVVGNFGAGGALVPTLLQTPIIELLRNLSVLDWAGIRTMAGLSGNIVFPRQEGAATAYSVGEIETLTASQQVLGQLSASPKRVGATEVYGKQLLMQSSPDVEAFIREDLFQVIALKWDYLGLAGSGAGSEPTGIINAVGVGSTIFGATPTYAKLVSMETAIRSANVRGPLRYVTTPTVKGTLKTVAEALTGATTIGGSQNALWKPDGTVNGYPALDSNQIPGNKVLCGDFSQLIKCLWGGLDVVWNPYTKAKEAEIELTINTWGDYVLRHAQAFNVSADAGNQ